MPVAERLLVDTNILLEATDAKRPYHQEARELIESYQGRSRGLALHVLCSDHRGL